MKLKLFIPAILVFCSLISFSQSEKIEIVSEKPVFKFVLDGQPINFREMGTVMKTNQNAFQFYKKAKSNNTMSTIFAGAGGFLIGYPIGGAIGGAEIDGSWYATLGVGCALGLISIPFTKAAKKNLKLSIEEYNKNVSGISQDQIEMNFGVTSNGLTPCLEILNEYLGLNNYIIGSGLPKKYYSEDSLWQKIGKFAKLAGTKVIYAALLLYFVMKDKDVPLKTKVIVTAALGYFIFPADAIPDLAPLVGFTDDFGVLMFALSQISGNLTPEIKQKAKVKLSSWFGEIDDDEISEVNNSDH